MSHRVSSVAGSRIEWHLVGVALAVSAVLLAGAASSALPQGGFSIGDYRPVSKVQRIGEPSEEAYRARLTNGGAAVSAVRAKVVSLTPEIVVLEDTLVFQPVPAGGSVVSLDTFSILRLGRVFPGPTTLAWTFVPNQAPVAHAGADETLPPGALVRLNGAGSTDADGDALTFAWSFLATPPGSMATLSGPASVAPSFTLDVAGTYLVQLLVSDALGSGAPDVVAISTSNSPPVADAGADRTASAGQTVTLDGGGSSDYDGDELAFSWTLLDAPAGSGAALAGPTGIAPTFVVDVPGSFTVQLVVHDGQGASAPDTLIVSTANSAPVADAGADRTVAAGTTVMLDATGTTDVDGDLLTLSWSLTSVPAGSSAGLDDVAALRPLFVADQPGVYVAQLVASDGTTTGVPDTVVVTTLGSRPGARAGADQATVPGGLVQLDGSASQDADGDPLTFRWALTVRPTGSAATLAAAASVFPSFVPDLPGEYLVQLVVDDGATSSDPDTLRVSTINTAPRAEPGADRAGIPLGQLVTLDGSGSVDPDGDPLSYSWSLLVRPAQSESALSGAGSAADVTPDVPGDYLAQLVVGDGFVDGAPATVLVESRRPVVTVAASDAQASEEGSEPGTFTLARTGDTTASLDVQYLLNGSATAGDYTPALTGTFTIPAGAASAPLVVTPAADLLVEGAETLILVLSDVAAYDLGAPGTQNATIAIADTPPIELALVGAHLVRVGQSATPQAPLAAPAPAGGILVSVSSDDPGRVAVAAPGTTTIAEGTTTGQVTLTGVASGTTTVRANAAGLPESTLLVTATANLISAPATLNVPLGQSVSLPITITRDAGNVGDVLVDVTSDDPSAVHVTTPVVTVPAGQFSVNATVFGQGDGSATLSVSAAGFVPDATQATTTATLNVTVGTLTINASFGGSITIQLESPAGNPAAAPTGGLVVGLGASDPTCVSVPATATIQAGTTSVTVPVAYAGSAVLPRTSSVTVSGPTGFSGDSVSVIVNPTPSITVSVSGSLGGGLQSGFWSGQLGASNHGGVTVHVESGDPSRVLLSPNATTLGTSSLDLFVANGSITFGFFLQGSDWLSGTSSAGPVTITASAPGFTNGTGTISYVQPALRVSGVPATTTLFSPNTAFRAEVGIPSAGNANVATLQARRFGAGNLTVTVTNSNAAVGEIDPSGGGAGAQIATTSIAAGTSLSPFLEFDPLSVGTTTVSASIPDFIATTASSQVATVNSPGMTLSVSGSLGGGLQSGFWSGQLGASNHGGVTVHVESGDPSRVLLSPNATTLGTSSLDLFVANGSSTFNFWLQGTDWVSGTSSAGPVTITASAPGFPNATGTISYVQPALRIAGVPATTTTLSPNTAFRAEVGIPSAGNANVATLQARRFGAGSLTVTVTNSNPAVGEIDPSGGGAGTQIATTSIAAGTSLSPFLEFDPLGVGTTTVSASIPDFIATTASSQGATVSGPGMTLSVSGSLGGGLQSGFWSGQLGASNHGGVTVHVESGDPSRVLLSPNATTLGTSSLDLFVANGSTTFNFWLQGTDWLSGTSSAASVTITASAPGFPNATGTISYVQPALQVSGVPATTTTLSPNTAFRAQVGIPNTGNTTLATFQARRFGAGSLTVTVTNSNPAVGEIDPSGGGAGAQIATTSIAAGTSLSSFLEFDPLAGGTTTVSASIPNFVTTTAGSATATVNTPTITLPGLSSVGSGLQTGTATGQLGASAHGGVTVHLTSSDPSRVLLAPNGTTAGAASIDVSVANGQTGFNFVVQGTDWVTGTSSAATVVVTASAPGFLDDTSTASYAQAALRLSGLVTSIASTAANDDFIVQVGLPNANSTDIATLQVRRAGAPLLSATVTNGNAAAAELDPNGGGVGAQVRMASIVAGQSGTPDNQAGGLELDPLAAGTTTVSASIPGFLVTTAGSSSVTVTP